MQDSRAKIRDQGFSAKICRFATPKRQIQWLESGNNDPELFLGLE
jgi:hypothetical protein